MKVTAFAKASVSASAVAALTIGLTSTAYASPTTPTAAEEDAAFASPAAATTLVGVGSDTTQDVMYGVAKAINGATTPQLIASYSATGTGELKFRSGKTFAAAAAGATVGNHPNGSGAGYKALTDSIGLTAAGNAAAGDVDFARASGTQGTAAQTKGAGVTTDIPFAVDTMSVAVPAGSPFLSTNGGAGLTITDLAKIYGSQFKYVAKEASAAGDATAVVKGTLATEDDYNALDAAAKTHYEPINAFLPKVGSGSREFFLKTLATQGIGAMPADGKGAFGSTAQPAATPAPYVGEVTYANKPVQEHDATVLTTAPTAVAAIAPFSGAKFIGYHNAKIADPDAGHTAGTDYVLVPFNSTVDTDPATNGVQAKGAVLPYTGDASSASAVLAPNPEYKTYATKGGAAAEKGTYKLTRDVYNIIATAAVNATSTSSAKLRALQAMFVGKTSTVCQQTSVITGFGFLAHSDCGNTDLTFDENPSTATATVSGTGVAGRTGSVKVDVASNGNGGGQVAITVAGKDYTGTIAAGASSTTLSVATPAQGTVPVTGTFTPALAGVRSAKITGSITVAAAPVVTPAAKVNGSIKAVAPKAKHTKKAKVTVTVTAAGTVPTGTVTVVVKKGSKAVVTVKNKALARGKVAVVLPKKLKKGSYKVFVSYTGDTKVNPVALKSVTSLKVK